MPSFSFLTMNSLSEELFEELLSYVDSHQTLVCLSKTCRSLNQAVHRPTAAWNRLGRLRWPHTWDKSVLSSTTEQQQPTIAISNPQQLYRDRHVKDRQVYDWIKEQAVTTTNGITPKRNASSIPIANLHVNPDDAYDFLLHAAMMRGSSTSSRERSETPCPFQFHSAMELSIAIELFRSVHFQTVLHRFYELTGEEYGPGELSDPELLEEGAILLSESLWTTPDLVGTTPTERVAAIRDRLDRLAAEIMQRLEETLTANTAERAMVAVHVLAGMLTGNGMDYYNVLNSSIDHVMAQECGNPITLAVIYKLVMHRVGIEAGIIGLPGHVYLGIPGNIYIDVFQGGQVLTLEESQRVAGLYRVFWEDTFRRPLTAHHVLKRMLNNMLDCQSRLFLSISKAAEKTKALSQLLSDRASRRVLAFWPRRHLWKEPETLALVRAQFGGTKATS